MLSCPFDNAIQLLQHFEPPQRTVIVKNEPPISPKTMDVEIDSNDEVTQRSKSLAKISIVDAPPIKKNKAVAELVTEDDEDKQVDQSMRRKEGVMVPGIDTSQPLKEMTYEKYEKDEQ